MSIYGLFAKPDVGPFVTSMSTYESHDDLVDAVGGKLGRAIAPRHKYFRPEICEEAVAELAQYESDAEAMKVIPLSKTRVWFRHLTMSPEWRKKLYELRETLKARRQVVTLLDLLDVAARTGWSPDVGRLNLRRLADEYIRVDRKVFDQWTLLVAARGHRTFLVEKQGDAYDIMRAFVAKREINEVDDRGGRPTCAIMLVCPGNLIAARWRPRSSRQELLSTHEYRRSIGSTAAGSAGC